LTPEQRDPAYLWDMLDAAKRVREYTAGLTLGEYLKRDVVCSAVERQLEVLGEAARRVSDEVKQQHSEIPWPAIVAQRNVIAHEYGEINHVRIWKVVTTHIPDLIRALESLIPPLPPETP
jgi:uncharacterized protein with HEPN domain